LEQIKKISGQLKGMTEHMALTVKEQGEAFGKLENHVIEIKDNAYKAEKAINDAEKDTRRTSRKVLLLFLFVCFVVLSIIVLLVFLMLPNK
jgi:t-SNARE complex subunit (syntaxin)